MKPCVVFLIYHGQGHFNPCFRLAKILQAENEVVFAGYSYFKNYVEGQGFRYYALQTVPFGLGFEPWFNSLEKKKNLYWHTLKDRWSDRLYTLRETELHRLLNEINPEYLFIDSAQSTDFIVLYQTLATRRIKTAVIHANLSTITACDLPPLNSAVLPRDPVAIKKAHWKFRMQNLMKTIVQSVKYFGKSNKAIVKKRISQNHIPAKHISNKDTLFSVGLDHIDHFIMAPGEFEFPSNTRLWHHYVGFMIDTGRIEKKDLQFENAFEEIDKQISACKKLIYCSFGTVQYDDLGKVTRFLKILLSFLSNSAYVLVVSGNMFDVLKKMALPANVFIFKSVPHFVVLPKTSVFIMHGGFNSIKESIHAHVPMLVYPVDPRTDQNGNAARIEYHQLGLRGDLSNDSEKDIAQKIHKLMTDDIFKNNIEEMLKKDARYTERAFLELVKKIEPLSLPNA